MSKCKKCIIPLFLVLVMVLGAVTGCSSDKDTKASGASTAASTAPATSKPEVPVKLKIITIPAGAQFPDGTSIMKNEFFDLVKNESGYDLEWSLFKIGAQNPINDQLSLLLASGNAPDLIQVGASSVIYSLAKNGGFTELDEPFQKNAVYMKTILNDEALSIGKVDGKLYAIPRYTGGAPIGSMAVRKDWLDELGLKVPSSLDEYYNVFKEIKENKENVIPLVLDQGLGRMYPIMGAFGIYSTGGIGLTIKDGEVIMPIFSDEGAEFIKYMNMLYKEGLIDKEFLVDKEPLQKMIAGKGAMMALNYVEMTRNMAAFKEKNPTGKLEYIDPPVGKNGEQGYRSQELISQFWLVPKTSASKADDAIKFLDICNSNKKIVEAICYGFEGKHFNKTGDKIEPLPAVKDVAYKGYYSRVIVDSTFDNAFLRTEGGEEYYNFADKFKKKNDIMLAPLNIPSTNLNASELYKKISDMTLNLIVAGYSDKGFNEMKDMFKELKGEEIIKEYKDWYDNREK